MSELKLPEVNRVLLSGRLTRDPDQRYAPDGTPVTNFAIAFHRRYRGRDGKLAEQTGFATVMTYQRLAEVCGQYLRKGSAVLVEGRLQIREWATPRGEPQKRLEIRGEAVHFLERTPAAAGSSFRDPAEAERGQMEFPGVPEPPETGDER